MRDVAGVCPPAAGVLRVASAPAAARFGRVRSHDRGQFRALETVPPESRTVCRGRARRRRGSGRDDRADARVARQH